MNPEDRQLLERAVVLSEENNNILRGMRRAGRWATVFKILYWIAIIGLSYGAYVYIQPYVDQLIKAYQEIQGGVQKATASVSAFQNVVDTFQ